MAIHMSIRVLCAVTLLAVVGCGSTNSTKNLTESSAKAMLSAKLTADHKDTYLVSFAQIQQAIAGSTREDYSQGVYPENIGNGFFSRPNPAVPIQRLLKAGYIVQTHTDYTVPNVSGNYRADLTWPKGSLLGRVNYTVALSMKSSYASVTGTYAVQGVTQDGQNIGGYNGPVEGTVNASGPVHLAFRMPAGWPQGDYTFQRTKDGETLAGPQFAFNGLPTMTLSGNGPGGTITVPVYSYAFSAKFTPLSAPHEKEISAGTVEIDNISNLLLATDTTATASFTWLADFNDVGKALTGQTKASGKGEVLFGKQPDGNWIVAEYNL
jgi:hypothetical protein